MDPKNVKLTTLQKIKPLLKAIDKEVPWQIILGVGVGIFMGVYITGYVPVMVESSAVIDFILRRFLLGTVVAGFTFVICTLLIVATHDFILPLIDRIKGNYEEESFKIKKKILDDVIDDEILKK